MMTQATATSIAAVAARGYTRLAKDMAVIPDPHDRPVMTAEEAFAELGIDRSTGYKAIREGTFPVPVVRIGRIIRVPTVALRRVLQLDRAPAPPAATTDESSEAS
jgi:predicted DNA-binding transcriptional regulator AlpA